VKHDIEAFKGFTRFIIPQAGGSHGFKILQNLITKPIYMFIKPGVSALSVYNFGGF